jgi:hypothetical protein
MGEINNQHLFLLDLPETVQRAIIHLRHHGTFPKLKLKPYEDPPYSGEHIIRPFDQAKGWRAHMLGESPSMRLHLWERTESYEGGPVFELASIEFTKKTSDGTTAYIEFGDPQKAF